jgi:tRNA threonylcarbamoyladenosine biosynthesis protein TsaE
MTQTSGVPQPVRLETCGPDETRAVGRTIGENAQAGDVFLLTGPLGAGKTCLTQGIAQGLGVEGYVRSPTFVLMTRHRGRLTLHHVDLYRIGSPEEAWDLGLDEQLFDSGVCVIEWAERAEELLPEDALWLEFAYGDDDESRRIVLDSESIRFDELMEALSSIADSFPAEAV